MFCQSEPIVKLYKKEERVTMKIIITKYYCKLPLIICQTRLKYDISIPVGETLSK